MRNRILFAAGLVAVAAVVVAIFVLSVEERVVLTPSEMQLREAEEALTSEFEHNLEVVQSDTPAVPGLILDTAPLDTLVVDYSKVNCVAAANDKAIAGTDGGLIIYDPADSSTDLLSADDGLVDQHVTALYPDGSDLYIGTRSGLYLRDSSGILTRMAPEIESEITAIAKEGDAVYLGTAWDGLIKLANDSASVLLEKNSITAIQFGGGLMWVASEGEGLFYYDGIKFRKRFLEPDSTAFDHVSTLGYKHDRLFVGTPEGLYVFDGGSWDLYDSDDGLLVCDITSVAFKGWKILVGTRNWGYYEIFEDWVNPVDWSEALEVSSITTGGGMVIVGTRSEGMYVTKDKSVTNINPEPEMIEVPFFALVY